MTVGSRVNPNYPTPGVDQSSRGFRDNFAIIKQEFENLQGKHIQLTGGLISDPIQIGNGSGDIIIPTTISLANIPAAGSNLSVQYNLNGLLAASSIFYNNQMVGINTTTPAHELDVVGNIRVVSSSGNTTATFGNLHIESNTSVTNIAVNHSRLITINNANLYIGIGTTSPQATLDITGYTNDLVVVRAPIDNSDNSVRLTTDKQNATFGLALEHRVANKVGGMRIDQGGNITIHANESMDADLSDASRVISILTNTNVGIGSTIPRTQLDVDGNVYIGGSILTNNMINVSGSRSDGTALANLIAVLSSIGLIVDNTVA